MGPLQSTHLTTPIVWVCTAVLVVMDISLGWLSGYAISRRQFRGITRKLIVASAIFFLLVWAGAMGWAWDWFYAYIFPPWARYALPPIFCLGYALLAWFMTWLSLKLRGNPAVMWNILGGVEGLLSHLFAIYGLGAVSRPPIMQGTDPLAVLIFAIFEKAFYSNVILLGSWFLTEKVFAKTIKPLVHS